MKIKIENARVLPMVDGKVEMFEGEVHIVDDKITYVGESLQDQETWDRVIDAKGNVIMPGFKNAHTHSAMTFLRSYADDCALQDWLFNHIFPMEAKLTKEDQYELAKLAILEYLSSGITSNCDMYLDNYAHAKTSKEMGFRTVLCGSINDFGGTVEKIEEEFVELNEYDPLVSDLIGFHGEYTTKEETLKGLVKLAEKYHAPVGMHLSETKAEVDGCIERHNMTPMQYLDSIGMFAYGGVGFHGVYMDEKDMELCVKRNVSIVTNPSSNIKLASGIAPLTRMDELGVNLAIGTDGPASNNCLDMFREMFLVTGLQKVNMNDPKAMKAEDVLRMATYGGAHAIGLTDCDCLAQGKQADIIMIDLDQPNMQPLQNIACNIVYSGSKSNIKMTMVAGKILYEDGQYNVSETPHEIYKTANKIIERIKG